VSVKVSDYILQRLQEWGVEHVFGYAGDGINGLLAAWGRAENKPQFIQARHEEMAAFEAVGTPSSPDGSECAPRPPALARSTC
jgi:pyruvate dehydrogenase (quinone)